MAVSTARTPERSEASGNAACLLEDPPARRSRFLLAIIFVVGAWLLLAGWSDAAHADPAALNASCPVAPVATTTTQSSLGLPVPPATDPLLPVGSTQGVALPPPPCPAPTAVSVNTPLTGIPVVTPAVDPSAVPGSLDPSATTAGTLPIVGLPPVPPTDLLDPAGTTAVPTGPAPLDPALLDPALLDGALLDGALLDGALLGTALLDGALLDTALDTALTTPGPPAPITPSGTPAPADATGTLPCSEPAPAPAAVTDTGGASLGNPRGDQPAGTLTSDATVAALAADGAGSGALEAAPAPDSAPVTPVSPPVPVSLPVSPPVPVPAGPAGPAGSASAAASGASCHGAGQTLHGHGTDAVLVAEVAASLAQAALRSTSGFAGAVVGGADDPGVRPG